MSHRQQEPRQDRRRTVRLVVAPYASDETIGCGGMLAKHCDDAAVVVLAALDASLLAQFRTAQDLLGGPASPVLGLTSRALIDDLDQLVGALSGLIAELQPDRVYLPFPSDAGHLAAYEAGMRSTRPSVAQRGRRPISVLMYDVGSRGVADYPADVRWDVCESLREEHVDRKVAAATAYQSSRAESLRSSAEAVGLAGRARWAEQFALVRGPRVVDDHLLEDEALTVPELAGSRS
jgi:N-acetylglucosamine malate deacetylase 1